MNPVIEKVVQPLVNRSLNLATVGLKNSRRFAKTGASALANSTKTVSKVSDKALKLNKISHKTIAGLLNEQAQMVEGTLDATAKRLVVASKADSVQELWADQVELMPKSRARLSNDMKNMFGIVTETGEELTDLFATTLAEFRSDSKKTAKKATKKTASVAKKARKKTASVTKKAKKKTATVGRKARKKTTTAAKRAKKKTAAVRKTAKKKVTRRR